MPAHRAIDANQIKEKIQKKPMQHLDLIFDLLPENRKQAEKSLQLMHTLVKEKKLDRHALWTRMEAPIYFQETIYRDFSRRDPLIGKIARDGGLTLFNQYLYFKYGSFLSAELLKKHDIFKLKVPPIQTYIDKYKWPVAVSSDDKHAIVRKYYEVYGMYYEMLGDVLQAHDMEILKRLIQCQFDFNKKSNMNHVNQYLYVNRDNHITIHDRSLQLLLAHGLNPGLYLDMFLNSLWDECSLPNLAKVSGTLLYLASFLLDHGTSLSHMPSCFLVKLNQLLEQHAQKLDIYPLQKYQAGLLEEIRYLQGQLIEHTISFEKAKFYYLNAGTKGNTKIEMQCKASIKPWSVNDIIYHSLPPETETAQSSSVIETKFKAK